jgi:hypothetical protein
VAFDQEAAGLVQVARLGAEQADGLDVLDQLLLAQCNHFRRGLHELEQRSGGPVHADIGGLCREHDGDQACWAPWPPIW